MEGESAEEMKEDVNFTPVQSGVTRWHSENEGDSSSSIPPETTFSVSLDLSHYKVGDVIAIYSLARTDQDWVIGDSPARAQSNVVNARTNPDWSHVHANSIDGRSLIKGRLDFFSVPVTIEIGPQPGFFESNDPIETSVRLSDEGYELVQESELDVIAYALFMAVLVLTVTIICVFCREERDGTVRQPLQMLFDVTFTNSLYDTSSKRISVQFGVTTAKSTNRRLTWMTSLRRNHWSFKSSRQHL